MRFGHEMTGLVLLFTQLILSFAVQSITNVELTSHRLPGLAVPNAFVGNDGASHMSTELQALMLPDSVRLNVAEICASAAAATDWASKQQRLGPGFLAKILTEHLSNLEDLSMKQCCWMLNVEDFQAVVSLKHLRSLEIVEVLLLVNDELPSLYE